ncbi:MAG: hypothetical protein WCK56_16215 [Alcaligenaceae bacterium]
MTDKLRAAAQAALEWLRDERLDTWTYMDSQFYEDRGEHVKELEAALAEQTVKESLTVAEQEPVACIGTNGKLMWLKKPSAIYSKPRPLYTAPPRREWIGLTDEEILEMFGVVGTSGSDINPRGLLKDTRRIEAKLREKNGG